MEQKVKEVLDKIIDEMISEVEECVGNFSLDYDDFTFSYVAFETDEIDMICDLFLACVRRVTNDLFKEHNEEAYKSEFADSLYDTFDISIDSCSEDLYNNAETHYVYISYDFIKITPDIDKLEEVLKEFNII